jgi:peptide/nickel transport system permease protein
MKRVLREPFFKVGVVLFGAVSALGILALFWLPHDPYAFVFEPLARPSLTHLLGVNDAGMDIFSELLVAVQNTLMFGAWVAAISVGLGAVVGMASGYWGGWIDAVLMRLCDILIALPSVLVLLLVASIARPSGMELGALLGVLSFPIGAKVVRFQTAHLKETLYVEVALQMGASGWYVLRRHIFPALGPLIGFSCAGRFRFAVMAQATLAFLGLLSPSEKSFGMMIRQGMQYYYLDIWWHWIFPPVVLLGMVLVGVTFVIFSLEGVLDGRVKGVLRG